MNSRAIEGLKISVQCSNVVLSWPSVETETYIVQYRPTLNPDPGIPWQMLTNFMPAEFGTNVTVFVHSNIVLNPNCGGSGSSMMMSPGSSKPATCGRFKTSHLRWLSSYQFWSLHQRGVTKDYSGTASRTTPRPPPSPSKSKTQSVTHLRHIVFTKRCISIVEVF